MKDMKRVETMKSQMVIVEAKDNVFTVLLYF